MVFITEDRISCMRVSIMWGLGRLDKLWSSLEVDDVERYRAMQSLKGQGSCMERDRWENEIINAWCFSSLQLDDAQATQCNFKILAFLESKFRIIFREIILRHACMRRSYQLVHSQGKQGFKHKVYSHCIHKPSLRSLHHYLRHYYHAATPHPRLHVQL